MTLRLSLPVSLLGVTLVVGCGGVTLQSADAGDGAAGTMTGGGGSGGTSDGGGDVAAGGSSGGGAGGAAVGGASGSTGGASAGTGGASGGTSGASGGTGGASGGTGGAGGASGGAGGGFADAGVDASEGGADTHDAAPTCDAGSTLDGGVCVPIVVVIGSTAPCLGGGNVVYFDGDADNFIFKGKQTVTQGAWKATSSATQVHVHVDPTDTKQGLWWDVYFDSSKLDGALAPQVYENAMRWPFQTTGHPGLDVSGDGRGCNMVTGRFQIEELVTSSNGLRSFTATFEHHCEGNASAVRGCVHFEM
jgi:hypothetical protein